MTGDVSIRIATPADLDAVVAVHTAARSAYYRTGGLSEDEYDAPDGDDLRREGWTGVIASPEQRAVCAVLDGLVVGVAAMGPPPGPVIGTVGQLYQIHVLPGHWRRGIGSRLHTAFVDYLRENSLTIGLLEAWEHNKRGHTFYARHGWRSDGHRTPGPRGSSYLHLRLDLVT